MTYPVTRETEGPDGSVLVLHFDVSLAYEDGDPNPAGNGWRATATLTGGVYAPDDGPAIPLNRSTAELLLDLAGQDPARVIASVEAEQAEEAEQHLPTRGCERAHERMEAW